MCGIVGVAGDIGVKEKAIFKDLLKLDTLRGPHSTGIAAVRGNGSWDVVKKLGTPWELFDSRKFNQEFNTQTYCLIGHNRYATQGKVNATNAHPFEFEDVVGVHNGTLRGQWRLPNAQAFEVDSENIYYSIQEQGLLPTLALMDGAYALSYWDKRDEELVLLCNNERPLHFTFSKDDKTMYWASEAWMLHVALSRNNVKVGEVYEVAPEHIYRFHIDRRMTLAEPIHFTTEQFEEFIPPKTNYSRGTSGGTGSAGGTSQSGKHQALRVKGQASKSVSKFHDQTCDFTVDGVVENDKLRVSYLSGRLIENPDVEVKLWANPEGDLWKDILAVHEDAVFRAKMTIARSQPDNFLIVHANTVVEVIDDDEEEAEEEEDGNTYFGFNNRLLTAAEFDRRVADGCAYCSDPIDKKDSDTLVWLSYDAVFCAECAQQPEAMELAEGW